MNGFKSAALLIVIIGSVIGQPLVSDTKAASEKENNSSIWKGTPMNAVVEQFRTECLQQADSSACIKVKVLGLLEEVLQNDSFKVSETVSIVPNQKGKRGESGKSLSDGSFMDQVEEYVQSHDLLVKSPVESFMQGTSVRVSPRNLDENEITMTVQLPKDNENVVSERGKKHKLKKLLVPILVFVLLKAMTLIPLAIGVLGLKAWNALQLSFISFLVSISLAIFQLCKKVATDSAHIAPPVPWEPSYPSHYASAAARNFLVESNQNVVPESADVNNAQNMAYRGYMNADTSW